MKIAAYCPLHYGKEYLKEALESVSPMADRIVVLYTPKPSFGFRTDQPSPDSEEELRACCDSVKSKLTWVSAQWYTEGQHRDAIFNLCPEADLILPIDSDEVWTPDALQSCLRVATASGTPVARNYLIGGWRHYWRSLHWACTDVWQPVRIINPKGNGDFSIGAQDGQVAIHHLGYAQSSKTVGYKMSIHGHKNEIRPRWFEDIFGEPNRTRDLHPVVKDWWNAEKVVDESFPQSLRDHPNFGKAVIE